MTGKAVHLTAYGAENPAFQMVPQSAQTPNAGKVVVKMSMCPVNPADIFRSVHLDVRIRRSSIIGIEYMAYSIHGIPTVNEHLSDHLRQFNFNCNCARLEKRRKAYPDVGSSTCGFDICVTELSVSAWS